MTQGKSTPNIGQVGVKSIRLSGMTIDNLPIAEAARAKEQLPIAEETERQSEIAGIKARYPTQSAAYLESRIQEARQNIGKFRAQATNIRGSIEHYRMLLRDVERRDRLIAEAESSLSEKELYEEINALNKEYGLWQRQGLEDQLVQFEESIQRFEKTIEVEQRTIDELVELLGQCRARDKELARLGA